MKPLTDAAYNVSPVNLWRSTATGNYGDLDTNSYTLLYSHHLMCDRLAPGLSVRATLWQLSRQSTKQDVLRWNG